MRNFIAAAALLLVLPAVSQAKTLEQLLAEKGVITKAEASSAASSSPVKVYWNDGTRVEFPDNGFTFKIATFLQPGYAYNDNAKGAKDTSSFDLNNARIDISGTALHEEFSYELENDFASGNLKKVYLAWHACDWGQIGIGQFKTLISRQFNNTNWKLMFPDRTFVSNYFDFGYEKGLRAQAKFLDDQVIVGAGMFNGTSEGEGEFASGKDGKHMLTADVRWNAMGKMDVYEEGDINMTQDPALSLGAAYAYSPSGPTTAGSTFMRDNINRINVDANFKYAGLGINAEYFVSRDGYRDAEKVTTQGGYVQAGYFVAPKQWELALRYGMVSCDDGKGPGECAGLDKIQQASGGINYYFWKHNLKAQLMYDYQNRDPLGEGSKITNNRWVFQLSSYF